MAQRGGTYDGFFSNVSGNVSVVGGTARAFERPRSSPPGAEKELCWHCCHSFDWPGLPMPIDYDPLRDAFKVIGNFCGIGCMKAFNGRRLSHTREVNYTNISTFAKRCFGKRISAPSAPPRESLLAFGGTLTIEQFREKSAAIGEDTSSLELVDGGPTVVFVEKDGFAVPRPPEDAERRLPKQGETRGDFDDDAASSSSPRPSDVYKKKENAKKRPSAKAAVSAHAKKKAQRPLPTDEAVLKLKKSKCEEPDRSSAKSFGMLAESMGIEIQEIRPL
jgi:hypothetical protein